MKILSVHVRKLDDRSKLVVYLGKELGTKGSRLFDQKTGSVHVSRDVTMQEVVFWSWEEEKMIEVCFSGNYIEVNESADAWINT